MSENISKILIVDDVPRNIQVLGKTLIQHKYKVAYAQNGTDAINLIKDNHFDLILLDIMMPGMDGFEVCRRIKEQTLAENTPIIFLTARTDTESITQGFELGAVDYVTKPFNSRELLARVRTHVELKQKTDKLQNINELLEQRVGERTVQLADANSNLRNANKKIEKLDKAKSDFLLLINHELRTPLNGIMGFSDLLGKQLDAPQHKRFISQIKQSIKKLLRLTDLSLLITSLRAQGYKMNKQTMPVNTIIDNMINNAINRLKEKNIEVERTLLKDDLSISLDMNLLKNCLSILFDNAIKFSPPGSILKVKANRSENFVAIEIIDNGKGFSEDALNQLYEFFSTDKIEYHSQGFGLGIATAKLIVDTIGGVLDIQNIEDNGASVKITLPI